MKQNLTEMSIKLEAFDRRLAEILWELSSHFGKYLLLGEVGERIAPALGWWANSWDRSNENSWRKSIQKNLRKLENLLQLTLSASNVQDEYKAFMEDYLMEMDSAILDGMLSTLSEMPDSRGLKNKINDFNSDLSDIREEPIIGKFWDFLVSLSPEVSYEAMITRIEPVLSAARKRHTAVHGDCIGADTDFHQIIRDQRVELLVRQFSGGLSREEFRRLEMLNQCLTKLHPPVTNSEYVQLEKIVDLTEKAQKNNAAIRRRLNLD